MRKQIYQAQIPEIISLFLLIVPGTLLFGTDARRGQNTSIKDLSSSEIYGPRLFDKNSEFSEEYGGLYHSKKYFTAF